MAVLAAKTRLTKQRGVSMSTISDRRERILALAEERSTKDKIAKFKVKAFKKALEADFTKSLSQGLATGVTNKIMGALTPKKSWGQEIFGPGGPGRKALGFGAGAAMIGGGISAANKLSDSLEGKYKKKVYFKRMLADNPGLKKESPKDVGRIFNTLYRFNPRMAGDPLVAGSFMKRSLMFKDEGIQPVDVKTLTEVGKHLADTKKGKSSLIKDSFGVSMGDLAGLAG